VCGRELAAGIGLVQSYRTCGPVCCRRSLYNAALICRLVLTWFPNPPYLSPSLSLSSPLSPSLSLPVSLSLYLAGTGMRAAAMCRQRRSL